MRFDEVEDPGCVLGALLLISTLPPGDLIHFLPLPSFTFTTCDSTLKYNTTVNQISTKIKEVTLTYKMPLTCYIILFKVWYFYIFWRTLLSFTLILFTFNWSCTKSKEFKIKNPSHCTSMLLFTINDFPKILSLTCYTDDILFKVWYF